jgi:carbamoyltransferase
MGRRRFIIPEHHLSHAASAFYPSPFEEAAIVTIDGVGEWATTTIGYGQGNKITLLKELHFPHSVGLLYSAFTYYTGFEVNSGEYKLMGLAPYGNPESPQTKILSGKLRPISWISERMVRFSLTWITSAMPLALEWLSRTSGSSFLACPGEERRSDISQVYMDMALAIQQVTEEIVMKLCQDSRETYQ